MVNVRVVLVGIEGPVNLGVIARTCMNFGVRELYLVNPVASIEEAYRFAAKGRELLNRSIVVASLEEALKGVDVTVATSAIGYSEGDVLRQAISLEDFVNTVLPRVEKIALIFGRESTGLTREELSRADFLVTIPASREYPVLNVSQSVAIFLWEIWKKTSQATSTNVPPRASREELERLVAIFNEVINRVVPSADKRERCLVTLKRIIHRSRPSTYETKVLHYLARRVVRKIDMLSSNEEPDGADHTSS